jgi:hypothetical protein
VRRLTALVLIAGCANGAVTVTSQTLARHAPELRERGRAVVEARVVDGEYHYSDTTVEIRSDQEVELVPSKRLRIDALLAHCPPAAFDIAATATTHPECDLVHAPERVTIGYRRYSKVSASDVGQTVLTLGALGGLIACTIECSSPYDKVSGGVLIVTGVIAIGAVVLAVSFARKYDH